MDVASFFMNIIFSVDGIKFPLTGIGRYTYHLAYSLKQMSGIEQLNFFSGMKCSGSLPQVDHINNSKILTAIKRVVIKNHFAIQLIDYLREAKQELYLKPYGGWIFHGANFYLPNFSGLSICTIHDLSVYNWPEYHPEGRVFYLRKQIARALKRANHLIAVSEYVRQEIITQFGWPSTKITSIPEACSDEFKPRSHEDIAPFLKKYHVTPSSYSLYIGTIEPRKNITTLLDAYERLPLTIRNRWPLIIAGHEGWKSEGLHERMQQAQKQGWVRYLGFVSQQDLPLLYAGARLFIFPSLYEGFGLPILEAMASGVPVICSDAASLPEVAGDAAMLFSPHNVDELTDKILQGLEDQVWQKLAVQKGLQRSAQFSWQRCAEQTVDVYKKVSGLV